MFDKATVTVEEAAASVRLSKRTLYYWMQHGLLPYTTAHATRRVVLATVMETQQRVKQQGLPTGWRTRPSSSPSPLESELPMPRRNAARRTLDGSVKITIDSIEHTLTLPAFLELMQDALRVVQSIEKETDEG